uniref:Cytochrome c oxidase subunit 3 n=1 Tax=Diximermis spiculatus TaxID=3313489 RepID=Q1HBC1_9BILA|nr:cytochrome c oxidase subunit III [Strelkovimermis spiculatus]ABF48160.1 cytochrome c oxidase subunit 3 [Strelkovimermis spiculatus]ABF48172.1 cytochrome c oxidase subunit 3 [Strelkovimermis spiculatus]
MSLFILQSHLTKSWLPLYISFFLFLFLLSFLKFVTYKSMLFMLVVLMMLVLNMFIWFKELNLDSFVKGMITKLMAWSFKYGMVMFIFSELMFFITFFWSYTHFMLLVMGEVGLMWPPMGINKVDFMTLALLNSVLLLSSAYFLTISHLMLVTLNKMLSKFFMIITIFLGMVFLGYQMMEYMMLEFLWSDSVYGSIFYMTTSFHAFHVMVGLFMLSSVLTLMTKMNMMIFEFSAWYWHFVDVIWLMLYIFYYWFPWMS